MKRMKVLVLLSTCAAAFVLAGRGRSEEGVPQSGPADASRPTGSPEDGAREKRLDDLEANALRLEGRRGKDWNFPKEIASICSQQHAQRGRGYALSQARALRILEKTDDLPLEVHWDLVSYAGQAVDAKGKFLKGEAFAEFRKRITPLLLEAWQRTEKMIDKKWDPNEELPPRPQPPGPTLLGNIAVSPESIADPKIRAEYETALKTYNEKVSRYGEQYRARMLETVYARRAVVNLFGAYTQPPERTDELKELLEKQMGGLVEGKLLADIVQAVKDKKLPAHLDPFSITTRPDPQPASAPAPPPG